MKKIILKVEGMSCSACQNKLEKYLNAHDGINAKVNLILAQVIIEYATEQYTMENINNLISEAGYRSIGYYDENNKKESNNDKTIFIIISIILIVMIYISLSQMINIPNIQALKKGNNPICYSITMLCLTIPFILYGIDIIKSGILSTFRKKLNMDTLVTIGVLSCFIYSIINTLFIIKGNCSIANSLYYESAAMVIYFVKIGRKIDSYTKSKAQDAIKNLVCVTPQKAILKTNKTEKIITIDEVKKGDTLICKPGMKVAVDGIITKGETHLDESFITGESIPSKKKKNDNIIAGSINLDGLIEYKAENIGKDSTISQIVNSVYESINSKSKLTKIVDKVCGIFVPIVILLALITLVIYLELGKSLDDSLITFITILVVSCPCALGLATPLAVFISNVNCLKNGILIKSNSVYEKTSSIDTIVFDKTGTLTNGNIKISDIINYSNEDDDELLNIISSIEYNSNHPISNAFKEIKHDKKITNYKEIVGMGISAKIGKRQLYIGNEKLLTKQKIKNNYKEISNKLTDSSKSVLFVIEKKKIIAIIALEDSLRDNVKNIINELKKMKKRLVILSGDNEKISKKIASELEIDEVMSSVSPIEKANYIKKLQTENKKVMMIGDGINDAPALACADLSVSIENGTDIAADSSDVILMNDNLEKIPYLLKINKKTSRVIKENLFWAFIYNVCMILIATGIFYRLKISINPAIASIAMVVSSLFVTINSLRLKRKIR